MSTVSFNHASAAYRDATRVAEKIISETGAGEATSAKSTDPMPQANFQDLVGTAMQTGRDISYKGEAASTKSIVNEADLHDLITAVANAELTLNTVVAVRDRVISAYQDIIRMPI